jgi:hypothetical protein
MNLLDKVCAVALVAGVVCPGASGATRIMFTNASQVSASSAYNNRGPLYAVNGAGLNAETGEHSAGSDNVLWMSNTGTSVSGTWFRVDLGGVYPLASFKLWNCNFWHATVPTTNRGIYQAEVYLSSLETVPGSNFGDPAVWTRVIDTVTFAKAPGLATYTGEPPVSLAGLTSRWLALRVLSNFGGTGADLVGISELQVFAEVTPVVLSATPIVTVATQVTLPGTLTYDGGLTATVDTFWGSADGGSVSSAWDPAGTSVVWVGGGAVERRADRPYAALDQPERHDAHPCYDSQKANGAFSAFGPVVVTYLGTLIGIL